MRKEKGEKKELFGQQHSRNALPLLALLHLCRCVFTSMASLDVDLPRHERNIEEKRRGIRKGGREKGRKSHEARMYRLVRRPR